ncbi:MAG: BamA/TamA family outer membrane protein [Muribaculaceae bacterium]|nr:BamA/TamA family outer membrane protein [Muribaculaceae bacterium]MDE6534357.1 BamA/TamA family outer membrane protein [Muribaculaceae bacterium]
MCGLVAVLAVMACACSTTRRLGQGETRYTGVGDFDIIRSDNEKLPVGLVDNLKEASNCDANDYIFAPFIKIPLGLWVYNNWNDSAKGLKGWLYDHLAKPNVPISEVRPEMRVKLMEQILDNNGYFGSTASYSIDYSKKNKRKASIDYTLNVSRPYRIDSIIYFNDPKSKICGFIDSVAKKSPYLQKGEVFCVDSLSAERVRIANRLRNRGYYYFRPEYVEFLADSLITPGSIAIKMTLADNMPQMARTQYRTGKIVTTVLRKSDSFAGTPDTVQTPKGEVIVMRPAKLRKNLIPSCITFRPGKLFSVRDMDRTQTRLSRLGIFGNIQIQPVPADTSAGNTLLDVYNIVQFDDPMEASIEVNATSKSNSYLGPGLILGLANRNTFGGGERLSLQFNADYEWQTGRNRSSVFNSYEFGLTASLAFPRMLAPRFIKRTERDLNWTTISLGVSILNRPHFFKLAEFNTGITYEWRASRYSVNQFTPFKLTYNKLISTTHEFDSIMSLNPAVALSFQSQFIPQLSYTYTYDRFFEREKINGINFSVTFTEAGNLFDGIWSLCRARGEKKLFGTPFSQFVKGQAQLVYNRRLVRGSDQWLVSRVLIGAAHAYGNSREVPYSEQFYIGGANSIRAFTVRSIGPGSYRAPESQRNGYFDQTGTFKLELNTEYRFPIISVLHGAVFLDAGNIWLLKNDPLRPGGTLTGKHFLKDIALGTGVGLRVDIGMMVIRGDLGYGLHAPYDTGTPHYFNIRFKDAFAFHLAIGYPF